MRHLLAGLLLVVAAGCATPRSTAYLAKVNDETITGKELRQEFARSHSGLEKILGDKQEIRRYIANIVDRRLFVQEAYRMGLHEAPDVREAVERFRARKVIEGFVKDEIDDPSKPTDEEVKAVHATLTHQLEIRQIVVRTKVEAEAIAAAVRAGANFETLAREKSIAPSAKRGGMAIAGWGADEAYEAVLPALAEGEMTPVFQSKAGWEIIRLEKRKPLENPPRLEVVAKRIRQILANRKRAARQAAVYASLWPKYGARFLDCAPTLDDLKKASGANDASPCATWEGGTLTAAQLAGRVKLDEIPADGDWSALRKTLIEDLVAREVMKREAESRGYALRPDIVDAVKVRQDEIVESKLYVEHVTKGLTSTDEDARRYYEAHKDAYMDDAVYELAHVLAGTPEAAALVEEKVRSRQPFQEIAAAHSQDKETAEDGGRIGFFEKKKLTGPLAPIAALEEGGVSGVVQTSAGYHVIKVLSIAPPRQRPFEDVKEQARKQALQERKDAERDRWVATLRSAARIEINEAGIRAYQNERIAWIKEQEEADREKKANAASDGMTSAHGGSPAMAGADATPPARDAGGAATSTPGPAAAPAAPSSSPATPATSGTPNAPASASAHDSAK